MIDKTPRTSALYKLAAGLGFFQFRAQLILVALILAGVLFVESHLVQHQYVISAKDLIARRGVSVLVAYFLIVLFSCAATAVWLSVRSRFLYVIGLVVVTINYLVFAGYRGVTGDVLGFSGLLTLAGEFSYAGAAISEYMSPILGAAIPVAVFVVVVSVIRYWLGARLPSAWVMIVPIAICVNYLLLIPRTIENTTPIPVPYKLAGLSMYSLFNPVYSGPRDELRPQSIGQAKFQNIVWIIDESVNPSYLSVNGYERNTTPFLESTDAHYLNLGMMASGSNCSSSSQLILMSGIGLENLPDIDKRSLKKPGIFQYAKQAGFATSYLSAQSHGDRLQNFMTQHDLRYIDNFVQPDRNADRSRLDMQLLDHIVTALKTDTNKKFIFAVKNGAHVPWEASYPENKFERYNGTAPEERLNHYENSLRWNVDEFFKRLFARISMDNTIILYTSDHGQVIESVAGVKTATHCDNQSPGPAQGQVPFLMFAQSTQHLFEHAPRVGAYSHFQLFPTTLALMGFESREVTSGSVFQGPGPRAYVAGDMFGRAAMELIAVDPLADGSEKSFTVD